MADKGTPVHDAALTQAVGCLGNVLALFSVTFALVGMGLIARLVDIHQDLHNDLRAIAENCTPAEKPDAP